MSLKTIVVGVDFSELSEVACRQAEALAREHAAELVLVHASGIDVAGMYVYEVAGRLDEPWKAYVHDRLEQGREQLRALADEVQERGVRTRTRHIHGFADSALVDVADEVRADLVVVGTHGRTGMERWLLGSVAERVVRICERDVLVARPCEPQGKFRRLLVPTDYSPASSRALELALALATPGATVELLHCWQPPFALGDETPVWLNDRLIEDARQQGNALLSASHGAGVSLDLEVVEGAAASTIHDRLQASDYDAAVLGSHGRRGVRRMILGSVAEHTIRYAKLPVFVAHGG